MSSPKPKHKPLRKSARPEGEEWIATRFPLSSYVNDRDPPYRPHAVVWLSDRGILRADVVYPEEPNDVIGRELREAMERPMVGPPRRPARIRVQDPQLVDPIRAVVGNAVAIRVGPTPEADRVREFMAQMPAPPEGLAAEDEPLPYGDDVAPAVLAGFHRAAAQLYEAAPWEVLPSDQHVLGVDAPRWDVARGCISVIGQMGESYGFLLFRDLKAFLGFSEAGMAVAEGVEEPPDLGGEVFAVNYERGADIAPKLRQLIMQNGWELAGPTAYPEIMRVDADRVPRPLRQEDVLLAWALCEALRRFFDRHGDALAEGPEAPLRERYVLAEVPGAPEIVLGAPHPDAPAAWYADDEDDADQDDAELAGLLRDFRAALGTREREHDDEWRERAVMLAEALCRFKLDYLDTGLDRFNAAEFEDFLLQFFPRKIAADEGLIQAAPEALSAFALFLRTAGVIGKQAEAAIQRRIDKVRAPFLREAKNPARFGIAKSLVAAMQEQGVDLTDPDAVQEYVDRLNAGRVPPPPRPRRR